MKNALIFAPAILLIALAPFVVRAQNGQDLYQKALVQERAEGNLEEAITIYRQVVGEAANDRTLAARALVQIGQCYEKLGQTGAQEAYEQVVSDFADQADQVQIARARLTALQGPEESELTIRRIWDTTTRGTWGQPSPDGRLLTFNYWGERGENPNLALRDVQTGESRLLIKSDPDSGDYSECAVWSPDATQVVYCWWKEAEGIEEIRLVGADGSNPRVIYSSPGQFATVTDWFPGAAAVLASIQEYKDKTWQIARISVPDGSARVLRKFDWPGQWPGNMVSLSPDANYIAYDFPAAEGSPQRDIYVLAADGSQENPVVTNPANDRFLGWAPNGDILFLSNRTGEVGLWIAPVSDGKPVGEPGLLKRDMGSLVPLGFTAGGTFFFARSTQMQDVHVANVDFAAGRLLSLPTRATENFLGNTGKADWSPDGEYLSYVAGSGTGEPRIRIRSLATGEEREVGSEFNRMSPPPRWSPDGRSLLLLASDENRTRGCYLLDVRSGTSSRLFEDDLTNRMVNVVWAPDGAAVLYNTWNVNSASRSGRIVRRELGTGEETVLHEIPYIHNQADMAVSPDGSQLAFTRTFAKADDQVLPDALLLMPTSGGQPREVLQLTPDQRFVMDSIAWTTDGRHILYAINGSPTDGVGVWRVSPDGTQNERLARLDLNVRTGLRFHPDERRVVFTASKGGSEVWAMENFLPEAAAAQQNR